MRVLPVQLDGVVTSQRRRALAATGIGVILCVGLWGSTLGRPRINLSGKAGYEEGNWGYDALMANRNQEAVRWLEDAVRCQPKLDVYWYDLGIGYERLGNKKAAQVAYRRAHQLKPDNTDYSEAWERSNWNQTITSHSARAAGSGQNPGSFTCRDPIVESVYCATINRLPSFWV